MMNFKIVKDIKDANVVTHNGKFHIDEVFSTVFATKLLDYVNLIRVPFVDESFSKNKLIYDIGKGEFDHHQVDAKTREDGIKYCSFGLLWKKYGEEYLKQCGCKDVEFAWKLFDLSFVKTIDKIDNFQIEEDCKKNYLISDIIEGFNPSWNEQADADSKFEEVVKFATQIFDNEIRNVVVKAEAKEYLAKTVNPNCRYLVLEKYIPYNDYILEYDKDKRIEFVIFPSKRNGYEIRTIFDRKKFPEDWYLLSEEVFFEKYGIMGMLYCHSNCKLCIASDLNTAINIVNLT